MAHRVLLAQLNAGGGHRALRDSFQMVLEAEDPKHHRFLPLSWDSSDRSIDRFYSFTTHHIPRFQGAVYALGDTALAEQLARRLAPQLLTEVRDMLLDQRPDVVVSCHFLLSLMLVKAKHTLRLSTPVLSAIPDYGIPAGVFNPRFPTIRPDGLIVMSEETHAHYVQTERLGPRQLHLSGFLPRLAFCDLAATLRLPEERRSVRTRILQALEGDHPQLRTLDPSRPTLLLMGGSAWTAKTKPILEALLALPEFSTRLNIIVVCGRDTKFQAELSTLTKPRNNFAVFGFVPAHTLAQLMAVADLPVLGSLAPATMQELLELGCGPLLLFHFIPGAEAPHTHFIREHRIGRYEPDPSRMVDLIMQLTGFAPPQPDVRDLLRGFGSQARRLRAQSRARARQLPDFLSQWLNVPEATPLAARAATELSASLLPGQMAL
jgi:UDP-N-acetylglucosamine:LPS N-acetylglucosamine transferase